MTPLDSSLDRSAGHAQAPVLAGDGADVAFMNWIERLERLLENEIIALKSRAPIDFDSFNSKKTHALLEFRILSRTMPDQATRIAAAHLASLRARLADNAQTLEQHLRAMSEISCIMIKELQAEESYGAYPGRSCPRR
jgi:hypothetical protein